MELWQSLLVAFGGNAALLLVLGCLGRSLISTVLQKDVEHFKAALQVSEFTSPLQVGDPDRNKQCASAINSVAAYFRFCDQHRIWLPPALCEPLEAFARQLRTPTINLGVYLQIGRPTEKTLAEQSEVWDKAWEAVNGDVPKLRFAVEEEFRKLLGAGSQAVLERR